MARDRAQRRFRPGHRLRHGRHLDRRRAFRRRLRARFRDRGRGRAHARADDADPYGRGRRRLDPAFRRRALPRRSGLGGRRSGPDMLSPRRPARGHRRQRDGRQADPGLFPDDLRPGAGPAARCARRCATRSTRWRAKSATGAAPEEIADGFIAIAVAKMAEAIKKISVAARLRRDALCAQLLRRRRRPARLPRRRRARHDAGPDPSASSLLSAYGMGLADIRATREPGDRAAARATRRCARARRAGRASSARRRKARSRRRASRAGDIKLRRARAHALRGHRHGARSRLARTLAAMRRAFESCAQARFGFVDRAKPLVVEAIDVEAIGGGARFAERAGPTPTGRRAAAGARARGSSPTATGTTAPCSMRATSSRPAQRVAGPALIIEPHQTIVVEPGWQRRSHREEPCRADAREPLRRRDAHRHRRRSGDAGDLQQPVHVDRRADGRDAAEHRLFGQHQGAARFLLRGVRRATARLVANAPHMPVHLGSMDRSVETHHPRQRRRIRPGDVFALNAPYNGGTHLPDITVCTPVFDAERRRSCSGSPPRPPRRHRRHRAGLDVAAARPRSRRKASISTISSWSIAAAFARRELYGPARPGANYPARNRCRTSTI